MKRLILLSALLIFACSSDDSPSDDDNDNNNNPSNCDVVYLDDNGITVKACDGAVVGESGVINGITYTILDRQTVMSMIRNYEDVSVVCTSLILDMERMGGGYEQWGDVTFLDFNQDISSWDVSNVTNMRDMFKWSNFNQDISNWDVGNVTRMSDMFRQNQAFSQDISSWDVSSVYDFTKMFYFTQFNQDIGDWNVSSATFMSDMFNSTPFNQDIGNWDVNNVITLNGILHLMERL